MFVNHITDYDSVTFLPTKPSVLDRWLAFRIRAKNWLRNLQALAKTLDVIILDVKSDGTICLMHDSGTEVWLRADGNVDVLSERNIVQQTRGLLHLNPESPQDDHYTKFEDLLNAFPDRFSNLRPQADAGSGQDHRDHRVDGGETEGRQ